MNQSAERIIASSLRSLGYFKIQFNREIEDSLTIVADGDLRRIFLKVIVSEAAATKKLSRSEIKSLKTKAESENREAWSALVRLNNEGHLSESIKWKKISATQT